MKEFYINPEYASFGYAIRMIERKGDQVSYVSAIEMNATEAKGISIPVSMSLQPEEIQSLMNEMWRNGIRPTNQKDQEGKISIMKNHLEDMRKLVFKAEYKEQG